jgi:hypothetical protein
MKVLCEQNAWKYFREYVESYGFSVEGGQVLLYNDAGIDASGVSFSASYPVVEGDEHVVFMAKFNIAWLKWNSERVRRGGGGVNEVANGLPMRVGCWNTEQFSRGHMLMEYIEAILELEEVFPDLKYSLFDYSQGNMHLMKKYGYTSFHLPYVWGGAEKEMFNRLRGEVAAAGEEGKYDVGFIGSLSNRRMNILQGLTAKGYDVVRITGWGEDRDREIMRCKIIVNLHYDMTYQLYEGVRCDRLVMAGCHVVSENSIDDGLNDLKGYMSISRYSEIMGDCEKVLNGWKKGVRGVSVEEGIIAKRERAKKIFDIFCLRMRQKAA